MKDNKPLSFEETLFLSNNIELALRQNDKIPSVATNDDIFDVLTKRKHCELCGTITWAEIYVGQDKKRKPRYKNDVCKVLDKSLVNNPKLICYKCDMLNFKKLGDLWKKSLEEK